MKRVIKVELCVMQGGHVRFALTRGNKRFQILGGKIESGKNDTGALTREFKDELAAVFVPDNSVHLATIEAQAAGHVHVLVEFRWYNGAVDGILNAISKTAEQARQSLTAPSVSRSDVVRLHTVRYLGRCLSVRGRIACQL